MFTSTEKSFLLALARRSIERYLETEKILEIDEKELPSEIFKTDGACFVTLTIAGKLRGCIGSTEAYRPLYLDVVENAANAAFDDPRFPPLSQNEFENIRIEISILTAPQTLNYSSSEDLLNKLRPNIDGVAIRRGSKGATYLPQVWEELIDKEKFLSSLCQKAGLEPDEWKTEECEVWVYQVEKIS